jgi:hypothetical protein
MKDALEYMSKTMFRIARDPIGHYKALTYYAYTAKELTPQDGKWIWHRLVDAFRLPDKQKWNQCYIKLRQDEKDIQLTFYDSTCKRDGHVFVKTLTPGEWLRDEICNERAFQWYSRKERCMKLYYIDSCPDLSKITFGPQYISDGLCLDGLPSGFSASLTPIRFDGDVIGLLERHAYLYLPVVDDCLKAKGGATKLDDCKFQLPSKDIWAKYEKCDDDVAQLNDPEYMGINWHLFE